MFNNRHKKKKTLKQAQLCMVDALRYLSAIIIWTSSLAQLLISLYLSIHIFQMNEYIIYRYTGQVILVHEMLKTEM